MTSKSSVSQPKSLSFLQGGSLAATIEIGRNALVWLPTQRRLLQKNKDIIRDKLTDSHTTKSSNIFRLRTSFLWNGFIIAAVRGSVHTFVSFGLREHLHANQTSHTHEENGIFENAAVNFGIGSISAMAGLGAVYPRDCIQAFAMRKLPLDRHQLLIFVRSTLGLSLATSVMYHGMRFGMYDTFKAQDTPLSLNNWAVAWCSSFVGMSIAHPLAERRRQRLHEWVFKEAARELRSSDASIRVGLVRSLGATIPLIMYDWLKRVWLEAI